MERLPGFRDFYPEPLPQKDVWSADVRNYIFDTWRSVARRYAFREFDGPPLESLELYTAKSGAEIIGQLYNFVDKGERAVALRPEMTPTLARMIAAYERNYRKPIKWFSIPQLFRYERQQKGRLREHFQLNCDIVGEADPSADAELIALLIDVLRSLKLTADDFLVRLSSRNAWQEFFAKRCADAAKAYEFYQLIDKLEAVDPSESETKLASLGFSLAEIKEFIAQAQPTRELEAVIKNLSARGLTDFVKIDYNVIRGLAYYTGVVFEAFDKKGEFRAIAGGGRYDNLIKLISARRIDLPALGFGMGDVVLTELLKERGLLPKFEAKLDAFVLIEGEALKAESLRLLQQLRDAGCAIDYSFTLAKPEKQFKRAVELGAVYTIKLERSAAGELFARLKNIRTREEKTAALDEVLSNLRISVVEEPSGRYRIEDLLTIVLAEDAHALKLRVGGLPILCIREIQVNVEGPRITHENAREMLRSITSAEQFKEFIRAGILNFIYGFKDSGQFDVTAATVNGSLSLDLERLRRP